MCYIKYHPLDSAKLKREGVILESGPGNGTVLWMLGSVLLKGVRKIFSEFFEKSIDKHKIDAILESAVQSERSRKRGRRWANA